MHIFQQLVGINTLMYYNPSIMELEGFASHRTTLMLSLVVGGVPLLVDHRICFQNCHGCLEVI